MKKFYQYKQTQRRRGEIKTNWFKKEVKRGKTEKTNKQEKPLVDQFWEFNLFYLKFNRFCT